MQESRWKRRLLVARAADEVSAREYELRLVRAMRAQLPARGNAGAVIVVGPVAAHEPQRRDQLPDALARQLRVGPQQPVDLLPERVQLRRPLSASLARRLL